MLNKELIGDEKDQQIARLKIKIMKFQAYDQERKKYYSQKMQRLGELESYIQEMEHECRHSDEDKYVIYKLKNEIVHLTRVIQANKMKDTLSDKELAEAVSSATLRKQNKALRERIRKQKETINKLLSKLNEHGITTGIGEGDGDD